jgi:3-oxoacyl-[acyl-carrier protein] reductase
MVADYAVAIVTGDSCTVGREIAWQLALREYAVVVVYLHDRGEAEAVVDEILAAGGAAFTVRADIGDRVDVERLFDETVAAFGGADVVVHTAMQGTALVDQEAARRLRPGGAIVSLSSVEAITPALAAELRARDITVNGPGPGLDTSGGFDDVAKLIALLDRWRAREGA